MKMYCLKCQAHKDIENPTPDVTKNFTPIARAVCPDCGTKMVKFIGGPSKKWTEKMRDAKLKEREDEAGTEA